MIDLEKDYKEFEAWYLLDPDADTSMLEKDEFGEYINSGTYPLFSAFSCGFETAEHRSIETIYKLKSEINDLKQKLEKLESGEWISVEHHLPDDGEKVLVFILDTTACAEKDKVFGFIDVLTGEALRSDLITHWRPQVEPPKPTNLIDNFIADGGFDRVMGCKNGE